MLHQVSGDIQWFQFASFAPFDKWLTHGMFARTGGVSPSPYASLNGGLSSGDDPEWVTANRLQMSRLLPGQPTLTSTIPVHGNSVVFVTKDDLTRFEVGNFVVPGKSDALITQLPGIGLFWAYADCTPVMIVDPVHTAIALVHAGWRGTSGAVTIATLQAMADQYGTRPEDVHIGIGPSIGPCCYEVDAPVYNAFANNPIASQHMTFSTVTVTVADGTPRESMRLDVAAANVGQLLSAGVPAERIETCTEFCTGCRTDLFFSHRMENSLTGRHGVAIGLL